MFFKKKLLSENEFAKKFANELIKKVKGLKINSINNLEIVTELNGISDYKYFLDNCYSEYVRDPKLVNDIIERYLRGASEMYLPKENVNIDKIIPIIKNKRFVKSVKEINASFEQDHILEAYNEELFIFYAEDKEESIYYLSNQDLKDINFPIENVKEKAIENLKNTVKFRREGKDGYYAIMAGGSFEASFILLQEIWNHENFPVDGNLVIGVPARDVLFVTGSNDSKNLQKLNDLVKNVNEGGNHIISEKIFELVNGKFEVMKVF